jgi:tripartite-type tricarboxylate transporter receptor subunit TctC
MPPATTQLLSDAIVKISRMPDVAQKLEGANVRPSALTPKELTAYLDKEIGKWKEVGKKVKVE